MRTLAPDVDHIKRRKLVAWLHQPLRISVGTCAPPLTLSTSIYGGMPKGCGLLAVVGENEAVRYLTVLSGDELAVKALKYGFLAIFGYVLGILTNKYGRKQLSI